MSNCTTSAMALTPIRSTCFLLLGYAVFYLAMSLGEWYESEVVDEELKFKLKGNLEIHSYSTQWFLFFVVPILLAASLGGIYEALWKHSEANSRSCVQANDEAPCDDAACSSHVKAPGVFTLLKKAAHYKFWPLGRYAP